VENPKLEIQHPKALRGHLAQWFAAHGRDLPWRRTRDPYAIMVSEFMLQQTQVATVIPYYERWLARFPDFPTLAAATEAEVLAQWQGLGYYSRARNLHRAAQHVVKDFGGALPADPQAIATLPGVGRYTAGAIASFAFDLPVAAIDANIARASPGCSTSANPSTPPAVTRSSGKPRPHFSRNPAARSTPPRSWNSARSSARPPSRSACSALCARIAARATPSRCR